MRSKPVWIEKHRFAFRRSQNGNSLAEPARHPRLTQAKPFRQMKLTSTGSKYRHIYAALVFNAIIQLEWARLSPTRSDFSICMEMFISCVFRLRFRMHSTRSLTVALVLEIQQMNAEVHFITLLIRKLEALVSAFA